MRQWVGLLWIVIVASLVSACPSSSKREDKVLQPDGWRWPHGDISTSDNLTNLDSVSEVDALPHQCDSDAQCAEGFHCDPKTYTCVQCFIDAQCPQGAYCVGYVCVGGTECSESVPCPDDKVCLEEQGVCVDCIEGTDCKEGETCVDHNCVPEGTCIPGFAYCKDEFTALQCDETGSTWKEVVCSDGLFCVEIEEGKVECEGCSPSCDSVPLGGCGPDGCGGLCNYCQDATFCPEGAAGLQPGSSVKCVTECSCDGIECGSDPCGNFCGACAPEYVCVQQQCVYAGYSCDEGFSCVLGCTDQADEGCIGQCVQATRTDQKQALVYLIECVEGACGGSVSPDCLDYALGAVCFDELNQCLGCTPSCDGKQCGTDGCGGLCGVCADGLTCVNSQCVGDDTCADVLDCVRNSQAPLDLSISVCLATASPTQQSEFLGLATCVQQLCGNFDPFDSCFDTAVQTACLVEYKNCLECVPSCGGKQCGPDGCGGNCGVCQDGWDCNDGVCQCAPQCGGKECGNDGCGGSCGQCEDGLFCNWNGLCDCTLDCLGRDCGSDGCGGSCGTCSADAYCSPGGNCIPFVCQPGSVACDGDIKMICNSDGEWTSLGACATGSFCQGGQCLPWLCQPDTTICENGAVRTCSQNGAGWLDPVPCPQDMVCQQGVCVPAGDCGDIPEVGCCDAGRAFVCAGGTILVQDCALQGCGWIPGDGYGCGGTGVDPSGQFPMFCPGACVPDCSSKECGGDGCGGSCGLCPAGTACADGDCITTCVPDCSGKQCGDDGCSGECGICSAVEICVEGSCLIPPSCGDMLDCALGCFAQGATCFETCSQAASGAELADFQAIWTCLNQKCAGNPSSLCLNNALVGSCYQKYLACVTCLPMCDGLECGPDGCGGTCGTCDANEKCETGKCVPVCLPQCEGKECGSNGCGGSCGACPTNYECVDGMCRYPCQPSCFGRDCGPDGCGGDCGVCPDGEQCTETFQCVPTQWCGDGYCNLVAGEDCNNCPGDCGVCPTGCEAGTLPGCFGCACEDCVCANAPHCCEAVWDELCAMLCFECGGCGCVPQCDGFDCGDDGCGGSCGSCGPHETCKSHACVPDCIPDCDGKECGADGCGGVCGTCPANQTCKNNECFAGLSCSQMINCSIGCVSTSGTACIFDCLEQGDPNEQDDFFDLAQCVLTDCGFAVDVSCMMDALGSACSQEYAVCINCTPNCTGKECGPNGCGGVCGACASGTYCDNYKCKPLCTPQCAGKECGADGCDGSCGYCAADEQCVSGLCVPVCQPDCYGKQCGADGCGGSCGVCPPGTSCSPLGQCAPVGPVCGDGVCDYNQGESCQSCPKDCGICGNGCVATPYPGCGGCSCEECVCSMAPWCCDAMWDDLCVEFCYECGGCGCLPACQNKQCGDDGCGGSCGTCPVGSTCTNGLCKTTCVPSCLGKQCGPNGCGGSCGTCPSGFICTSTGTCQPSCVPDCVGKECGPDGCNGQCGLCGPQEACVAGQCQTAWSCEQLLNCAWECPEGDDLCGQQCFQSASPEAQSQYIDIWQCILDECGEQPSDSCVSNAIWFGNCRDEFNACRDCTPACTGKQCGPDGCDGSCGVCPSGYVCDAYGFCDCTPQCDGKQCGTDNCFGSCGECPTGYLCNVYGACVCIPDCINAECGPDGCGGSCGSCTDGFECNLMGQCESTGPLCGDGFCDIGNAESCLWCPMDCGECGGPCCEVHDSPGCDDPMISECVCKSDSFCCEAYWDDLCVSEVSQFGCGSCGCVPNCVSADGIFKECGDDGCGGLCGICPAGTICDALGHCISSCIPNCTNKQCGPNGCGGTCGTCPVGKTCNAAGQCIATCVPSCTGKECGSNGCGGTCGTCPTGKVCNAAGLCIPTCMPSCTGKQCGPDGCGGTCGACDLGLTCNSAGQCVCVPNCTGKQCGSDGCGGTCGTCGAFQTCSTSGKCVYVTPLCGDHNCMALLGENCDSCPQDCGQCCGNGQCEAGYLETCQNCSTDCGQCCGNGLCQSQYGESCTSCPTDCGVCPVVCGDNSCDASGGEDCATCPKDCGVCPIVCGDGMCDYPDETCDSCPDDCGVCPVVCGDGECDAEGGEDCVVCPEDCGDCPAFCGDGQCDSQTETCVSCAADCGSCSGSCCTAHATPGCNDPDVQNCVCGMNPTCCDTAWSDDCASMADLCGSCSGSCCEPNGSPGCEDAAVEQCVCAQDSFCCDAYWDDICVTEVQDFGCGTCSTLPGCGDGFCADGEDCNSCPADCGTCSVDCGNGTCQSSLGENCYSCPADCGYCPGAYSCCTAHPDPGCIDDVVESCVCDFAPWCCDGTWDETCVKMAGECGSCTGSCCAVHPTPGCEDLSVSTCVCNVLPNCCDNQWDSYCANAVVSLGCGQCDCVAKCTGKECGPDGCGGTCGTCPTGEECNDLGRCVEASPNLSCADILTCTLACGGNSGCMAGCYADGSPTGQSYFDSLMLCIVGACSSDFSTQCMLMALMSTCQSQYQACNSH